MIYTENWTLEAKVDAKRTRVEFRDGTSADMTLAACRLIQAMHAQLLRVSAAEAYAFRESLKAVVLIDSSGLFDELKDGDGGQLRVETVAVDTDELRRQAAGGNAC